MKAGILDRADELDQVRIAPFMSFLLENKKTSRTRLVLKFSTLSSFFPLHIKPLQPTKKQG
jgi:hypothetical protein